MPPNTTPSAPTTPPSPNPTPPPTVFPAPSPLPPGPESKSGGDHEGIKGIVSTFALLIAAPIVAIFLTLFVFQSYQVDGPSMQTTLQNRDRLIVFKLPRTWAKLTHHQWVPPRGTIIVFNEAGLSSYGDTSDNKQLIKRVVGLPGDHVVVKDGQLTIYNKANPNGFDPDKTMSYGKVITTTAGNVDITVPPGQIFVCGDNRPDSLDSRYFGTVPVSQIVGKLGLRVYPFAGPHVF